MRSALWVLTVITASVLASLLGYSLSSQTGVEPGYFEAAEAGGYGSGGGDGDDGASGIDDEMQEYYKKLLSD
tara:strand:- start:336 stop:551 length:216 start_codon:yes stop_codon:yes gene_type:complete